MYVCMTPLTVVCLTSKNFLQKNVSYSISIATPQRRCYASIASRIFVYYCVCMYSYALAFACWLHASLSDSELFVPLSL